MTDDAPEEDGPSGVFVHRSRAEVRLDHLVMARALCVR